MERLKMSNNNNYNKFELGDSVICLNGEKGVVFLCFFINYQTSNFQIEPDQKRSGLWICSENLSKIFNYENNEVKRCKVLLIEKNVNQQIQKDTAKKFSSQLIHFIQQIKK